MAVNQRTDDGGQRIDSREAILHLSSVLSSVVSLNVLSAVDMNLGAVHIGGRVDDLCDFIRRADNA
jgi:hypothetical protein